jgi:acetolactate synthase-1/2/3 large subunit
MAVILHNLVGLLHACMRSTLSRPRAGLHQAPGRWTRASAGRTSTDAYRVVQGTQVRDYVKWDYQPGGIDGVPESFARAYSIMMTEPKGPIYMCYDAALQETPKTHEVPLPPAGAAAVPAPMAPDSRAIEAIADKLLKAEHPMLLPEYAGRRAGGFESIVSGGKPQALRWGHQQRAQFQQRPQPERQSRS